jgi:hypothetical protein
MCSHANSSYQGDRGLAGDTWTHHAVQSHQMASTSGMQGANRGAIILRRVGTKHSVGQCTNFCVCCCGAACWWHVLFRVAIHTSAIHSQLHSPRYKLHDATLSCKLRVGSLLHLPQHLRAHCCTAALLKPFQLY